jgi:PAS domain S-box-containing protein
MRRGRREPLSALLHRERARVVDAWDALAAKLPPARRLDDRKRRDQIPALVDEIIDAIERAEQGRTTRPPVWPAGAHAEERFEQGYHLDELAAEYAFLRRALVGIVAEADGELGVDGVVLLDEAIDRAIAMSIERYVARATRALEAERRRFDLALRGTNVGVFEQDRALRYVWAHNAPFGHRATDALGKTDAELLSSRHEAEALETLKQRAIDGAAPVRDEIALTVSGRLQHYEVAIEPIFGEAGRVSGILGVATDVTAQKRQQEDARKAIEIRDRILAIVSHDLKNPLSAISLAAASLLRNAAVDAKIKRTAQSIGSAADRAHRLMRDLLDYTKARTTGELPVEVQPARLDEIARQVVEESQLAHPQRILRLKVPESGDFGGEWDSGRVAQVLSNLVANAVQHSRASSPVFVELAAEEDRVVAAVRNANDGEVIPRDSIDGMFAPFWQGERGARRAGNVGLGLFIAHELVRAHGGAIEVESTREGGTVFRVVLPRAVA